MSLRLHIAITGGLLQWAENRGHLRRARQVALAKNRVLACRAATALALWRARKCPWPWRTEACTAGSMRLGGVGFSPPGLRATKGDEDTASSIESFRRSFAAFSTERHMARRATEENEKPAGGEDGANEWEREAGFSRERSFKDVLPEKFGAPAAWQAAKGRWHRDHRAEKGALLAAVEAVR